MDNTSKVFAAFGVGTSFALSGFYYCSSHLVVPPLYALPAKLSTAAFANVYYRGAAFVGPLTAVSAVATGTAAYLVPEKRAELGTAAVLTTLGLPWTVLVMLGTINRLLELGKEEGAVEREKVGVKGVNELLARWKGMNTVRAGFGLVGGAVSLWAILK